MVFLLGLLAVELGLASLLGLLGLVTLLANPNGQFRRVDRYGHFRITATTAPPSVSQSMPTASAIVTAAAETSQK